MKKKGTILSSVLKNRIGIFDNEDSPDRNHRQEGSYQFNLLNCVNIVLFMNIVFTEFLEGRH